MVEFTIRRANPEDAPSIVAILERIAAERVYSAITRPWTVEQQRTYLLGLSPREAFHLAVAPNGEIAGYQSLDLYSPNLESMSHVAQIGTFLLPQYRGQGAGNALFASTKTFAVKADYRKITIQVRGSNAGAQAYYRKLGFTPAGRLIAQVIIDGLPDDEILMELFL